MLAQRARDNLCAIAFCALVGGQDELVFDGHSLVLDHHGEVDRARGAVRRGAAARDVDLEAAATQRLRDARQRAPARARARGGADARAAGAAAAPRRRRADAASAARSRRCSHPAPRSTRALVTGLRDYVRKNGFRRVVLGLSGGIDSALVACVAADALGPEGVAAVVMPSPYSSAETQADARDARRQPRHRAARAADRAGDAARTTRRSPSAFAGTEPGLAEENLQARIRGNLLMALSNKFGWLVLTTGNKSEMSVGYSTLYGDLAGGFAVIKDCPKTLVYELARWVNESAGDPSGSPRSIVERAPSAELRPDQRDEDSLPPYAVLDPILDAYVEDDLGREQLLLARLRREPTSTA